MTLSRDACRLRCRTTLAKGDVHLGWNYEASNSNRTKSEGQQQQMPCHFFVVAKVLFFVVMLQRDPKNLGLRLPSTFFSIFKIVVKFCAQMCTKIRNVLLRVLKP